MKNKYTFHPKIIFRGPLKPIDNRIITEELLIEFFSDESNKGALFLSSPIFYNSFCKLLSEDKIDEKERKKIIATLYKYFKRFTTRTTPFGLMAGCGVIYWSSTKEGIVLRDKIDYHCRLDMQVEVALINRVTKDEKLYKWQRFSLNNSLYVTGEKIRYVERKFESKGWSYHISEVINNRVLERLILILSNGNELMYDDLVLEVVKLGFSREKSILFVGKLISSEFILSHIYPELTGNDMIINIKNFLDSILTKDIELEKLNSVLGEIIQIIKYSGEEPFNPENTINLISSLLESLHIPFSRNYVVQVDSFPNFKPNNLSLTVKPAILEALSFLDKNFGEPIFNPELNSFKERFVTRYGENEMPLLKVLDTEIGLGYGKKVNGTGDPNPYINDLNLEISDERSIHWRRNDAVLLNRLLKSKKEDNNTIQLKDSDFSDSNFIEGHYPDTMGVMFRLVEENEKQKIVLEYANGPSALHFIGRFTSGSDEIRELGKELALFENNSSVNSVIAEVVHLPESRVGNILKRTTLSPYEIPYLSKVCSSDAVEAVYTSDLMVSVINDRIKIRSKRLNKEVKPRMSNAHNYRLDTLPVYNFLCDMQSQDHRNDLSFSWGPLVRDYGELPRVEYNGVILKRATWCFNKKEVDKMLQLLEENNEKDLFNWLKEKKIPMQICLVRGDQELDISLEDPVSKDVLISELKKSPETLKITESFSKKLPNIVTNENGDKMANQFYGILLRKTDEEISLNKNSHRNEDLPFTNFLPGSDWIYVKIYSGIRSLEHLLLNELNKLLNHLLEKKFISSWFYVRYADPEEHLRIRFKLQLGVEPTNVFSIINESLISQLSENFWRVQYDTYIPEIDRYLGIKGVKLVEDVFHIESDFAIDLIRFSDTQNDPNTRWRLLFYGIDSFLNNFQFNLKGKRDLLNFMAEGYQKEFNVNKEIKTKISKAFREERAIIGSILNEENELILGFKDFFNNDYRNQRLKNLSLLIDKIVQQDKEDIKYYSFISSLIHMLVNKVLRSHHRKNELVIYTYLFLYYRSEFARINS